MGGMVLETNMNEILLRIQEQEKMEKEEVHNHFYILFPKLGNEHMHVLLSKL